MAYYVHSVLYICCYWLLLGDHNAKHLSTIKSETGHKMYMYNWILHTVTASCCSGRQL